MRVETEVVNEREEDRSPADAGPVPDQADVLSLAICDAFVRRCLAQYPDRVLAVVLTGSMARGEATFVPEGAGWRVLGDAEFLMVLHEGAALPDSQELASLRDMTETALASQQVVCHVGLSAVHPIYFRGLHPHVFAYELKACGRSVWSVGGEMLSLIPAFRPSDIPLEDAWRLLCNRLVENLEAADALLGGGAVLSRDLYYRTVKLYLDMATSYLLFVGAYEPTYRHRAENLRHLAEQASPGDHPFPLREFADRVMVCTDVKLGVPGAAPPAEAVGVAFWLEALDYARRLWRWELERLTQAEGDLSDDTLLERWMRRQPVLVRARGWLYVLRKQGWWRSWRHWPRWARRGWKASPRYWVYAAAGGLAFRLPELLGEKMRTPEDAGLPQALRALLPVIPACGVSDASNEWRRLLSDIVWNYHEFLEGTRA